MIRLIGSDLDGTLLTNRHKMLTINQVALARWMRVGGQLALVSGRDPAFIEQLYQTTDLNGYVIAFNGALIKTPSHQTLVQTPIPNELVQQICRWTHHAQLRLMLNDGHHEYEFLPMRLAGKYYEYEQLRRIVMSHKIYKITFRPFFNRDELLSKVLNRVDQLPVTMMKTAPHCYEVTALGINKLAALRLIAQKSKISLSEMMTFGDNDNDFEMLKYTGVGVAMGHAPKKVKQVAKKVVANPKQIAMLVDQATNQYLNI